MKSAYLLVALVVVALSSPAGEAPPTPAELYHEIPVGAIKIYLPEVQQPDNFSCGVASTMSVLAYYGVGPEDYAVLKKKLGTGKNGTDYQRIVRYVNSLTKKHGIKVEARPGMTLEQLDKYLDAGHPVICSIQAYDEDHPAADRSAIYKDQTDYGHFVVAIGYDKDNYYFMDPALTGRRGYLPRKEFDERWHDDEGTQDKPNVIHHLGLVFSKENGASAYASRARKID